VSIQKWGNFNGGGPEWFSKEQASSKREDESREGEKMAEVLSRKKLFPDLIRYIGKNSFPADKDRLEKGEGEHILGSSRLTEV